MEITIQSISLPAAIYDYQSQAFDTNVHFDGLFHDELNLSKFKAFVNCVITKPTITTSLYQNFTMDNVEYIASFTKISDSAQFLITLETATTFEVLLQESNVVRTIENEFYKILGAMHDDFVIIDKNGIIIQVLPNFETMYGISSEEAIGKSVFEMEERKIFNPSVAAIVLKSKKAETVLQLTGANKYLMCTAIPIKDENDEIIKIISYTRDVTEYEALKEEFHKLEEIVHIYNAELEQLREEKTAYASVIGASQEIRSVISVVERISKFDANVLFTGESGVGKTMFAKLLHSRSNRQKGPFIEVNCGAIPDSLLESELFGYEKGAFTGASNEGKLGLIELSNNGTLLLDEIGDLPLHMQVKLLKVIQEKTITRVGGLTKKAVDFRLIAATNKNLEEMMTQGKFREDLFYRLNVITINIPSLRERKDDIFLLSKYFTEKFNKQYQISRTLSSTVIDYLIEYDWPGNLRELENTIERLILTSDDYMVSEDLLPAAIKQPRFIHSTTNKQSLKGILESVESEVIRESYKKHGSTVGVAKELDISQPSASLKIAKYVDKS